MREEISGLELIRVANSSQSFHINILKMLKCNARGRQSNTSVPFGIEGLVEGHRVDEHIW